MDRETRMPNYGLVGHNDEEIKNLQILTSGIIKYGKLSSISYD